MKMVGADHVGPIVFSNKTARRQLQQFGEVVTFRPSERTTGETWWRKSRTGPKMGDCTVEKLRAVDPRNPHELTPSQHLSGFDSVSDWIDAIEALHGEIPDIGVLYRVTIENVWAECESEGCNEYSPEVEAFGHRPDDFIYLCPDCNNRYETPETDGSLEGSDHE
jgi:hypothetical protein